MSDDGLVAGMVRDEEWRSDGVKWGGCLVARVRTYTVRGKSKEERVLGDEVRA